MVNVALLGPPGATDTRHQTLLSQCWCVFVPFGVLNTHCQIYRSLYRNPCRSLELKCVFDEQANDSLQLSILESRLRLLCERPNQRTVGSQTQNVLQYVSFYNTEEKLHWTQARIPTCCLTVGTCCNSNAAPATSHECDHQRQWNVFVWFVCKTSAFWFYVDQECYSKT